MTGQRILYILYHKSPPHTEELLLRAHQELWVTPADVLKKEATGPPATTFNEVITGGCCDPSIEPHADWLIPFDPHFQWRNEGYTYVHDVIAQAPKRVGVIHFPGTVEGPQDTSKEYLAPYYRWGGNYRMLTAWRVAALRDIGGFRGVGERGRNWIPETTLMLERQGWQYHVSNSDEAVVRHHDPELTADQWFMSKWWYARDWTTSWHSHRGNPYFPDDLKALISLAENLSPDQVDRLVWQTITGLRLLGVLDSKRKWPSRPLRKAASIELD